MAALDQIRKKARARWLVTARGNQLPPGHQLSSHPEIDFWAIWFLLGGRGSGKTRTGAETLADWATTIPNSRWAVITPTLLDARETCFEGESGLLEVIPEGLLRGGSIEKGYNSGKPMIRLANGARIRGFSSERPGRLRGPAHHGAWLDEPAEFKDSDKTMMERGTTFSNAYIGCRNTAEWRTPDGELVEWTPKMVCSGTPAPMTLLIGDGDEKPGLIHADGEDITHDQERGIIVTRSRSIDNLDNLDPGYKRRVIDPLTGTLLGRQELDAEIVTEVEGASWKQDWIVVAPASMHVGPEDFSSIVIGVDPAGSTRSEDSNTGIVVAGENWEDRRLWVLDDLSGRYTPGQWADVVAQAYDEWRADAVIGERNYGGDMVRSNLQGAHSELVVKEVNASRGKHVRYGTISQLYEPREVYGGSYEAPGLRVIHRKHFPKLVKQMTTWVKGDPSPDALDGCTWALWWLALEDPSSEAYVPTDLLAGLGTIQ